MFYIVLLVLLGLLFMVAELVLLPGVSIGALLALGCYGSASYLAWLDYGTGGCAATVAAILLLSLLATVVALRSKTWQRLSLKQEIRSSSMPEPSSSLRPGDRGTTLSRLAPMGKVEFGGRIYEAKSLDAYIDPRTEVEVVGFENFSVIVKQIN